MMGSHSRSKGHRYERHIARKYRNAGWPDIRRGLQSRGGHEAADVEGLPFHVECKHYAKGGLAFRAWRQAKEGCAPGKMPIVHIHEDNGLHLVVFDANDWIKLAGLIPWRRIQENP